MAAQVSGSERMTRARRPSLALLAVLVLAAPLGGCLSQGPRFQAPFTLANPNERWPIQVKQGEATLDLPVYRAANGLTESQRGQLRMFLYDYMSQRADRLLVRAPSGGANERAAMRAFDDIRSIARQLGLTANSVAVEPYFANGDPSAPLRLSYLRIVAKAPDCPGLVGESGGRPAEHALAQHGLRHPAQSRRVGRRSERPARAARRDAASRRAPRRGVGQIREGRAYHLQA